MFAYSREKEPKMAGTGSEKIAWASQNSAVLCLQLLVGHQCNPNPCDAQGQPLG